MTSPTPLPTVGVLGLGIIGSRVADSLLADGYPLETWSRSPRSRADFNADPAALAGRCGVLLIFLKDAPAVRETFALLRPKLRPDHVLINHATIDLETTLFLEHECGNMGCAFLNCPFTGSKLAAQNRKLVYYAGGDNGVLERMRPLLERSSNRIIEVGSPLQATVLKLTTNLISASTVQALAESLQIAVAHGVSAEALLEAVQSNACGSVLATMKLPSMAAHDYEAHFSLSNMLKDSRYAIDLAERAGLETPGLRTVSGQMAALDSAGLGEQDFSVLNTQFAHDDRP